MWTFIQRLAGDSQLSAVRNWEKAYNLCTEICGFDYNDPVRGRLIDKALATSDICADAFLFHCEFQMAQFIATPMEQWTVEQAQSVLESIEHATRVGAAAVALMQANERFPQNLYNLMPTRGYVRALFKLGNHHFFVGAYRLAENAFYKVIGADKGDHIGARHYLVLIYLRTSRGFGTKQFKQLMQSEYGDGKDGKHGGHIDNVFANWNFSRALHAYVESRNAKCIKATQLLEFAINRNGYVPALLLGHDLVKNISKIMEVGGESEANSYADVYLKHWVEIPGALDWLAGVFGKMSRAPEGDKLTKKIWKGFSLINQGKQKEAEAVFMSVLPLMKKDHPLYLQCNESWIVCMVRGGKCKEGVDACEAVSSRHSFICIANTLFARGMMGTYPHVLERGTWRVSSQ
jgi:hypothetical protein